MQKRERAVAAVQLERAVIRWKLVSECVRISPLQDVEAAQLPHMHKAEISLEQASVETDEDDDCLFVLTAGTHTYYLRGMYYPSSTPCMHYCLYHPSRPRCPYGRRPHSLLERYRYYYPLSLLQLFHRSV